MENNEPSPVTAADPERDRPRLLFPGIPWPCQVWVLAAVLAALALPWVLDALPHQQTTAEAVTGTVLVVLSVLNVEIGRLLEGGASTAQRPHKALSAWAFATALLLPTWWLLPVVAVTYTHAWWRGLRVTVWKWVGSAAYVVLAGLAASAAARAILGAESDLMSGDGLRGLLAIVASATAFLAVETVLFHGSAYLNAAADETWLRHTLKGPSFYLTETAVLLVGGLSAAIWTAGPWFLLLLLPVYSLTQRAALHDPLRERADHDEKTGLLRFESWRRLAIAGAARCCRHGSPWSVLFVDLDNFKRFNDAWGHLAGDEALIAVARAICSELSERDVVGRFGGEEYCVFLPDLGCEDAHLVAERVRGAIETMDLPDRQRVTASVGGSTVEPEDGDVEFIAALTAADRALFDAKGAGRNTVRVSGVLLD